MIWTCLVFYGAVGLVFTGMMAVGERLLDRYYPLDLDGEE